MPRKSRIDAPGRAVKLPKSVVEALREQHKRTWKGEGENFVFLNKTIRHVQVSEKNMTKTTRAAGCFPAALVVWAGGSDERCEQPLINR